MELRQLRYVITLAEERHFGRAAAREHIAQAAFSEQIQRLERELGIRLFDRTSRSVSLTPAGEAVLERAQEALRAIDDVRDAAAQVQRGVVGRLLVGMAAGAIDFAADIVNTFAAANPAVDVEVRHVGLSDPAAGLRAGTDVALVWTPFEDSGLSMHILRTEPVAALLHRGHPLAGEPGIFREQLRGESIAYPLVPDDVWLEYWLPVPWRHTLRTAGTASSLDGLLSVVASGLGVSFCPASVAAQIPIPHVVAVPLLDGMPCQIAVAWADGNENPLVPGFVAVAAEVAAIEAAKPVPAGTPSV